MTDHQALYNELRPLLRSPKPPDKDGRIWSFCPCHPDGSKHGRRSLSLHPTIGLDCFAGCEFSAILAALGARRDGQRPSDIEATYTYRDEAGTPLFEVCRLPGKHFPQRRPGADTWGIHGIRRVLYRLPEVLAADPSEIVFVCEGEKDTDRLGSLGLTATTNPGGAGKWRPEYSESLRGRRVVILPDNDEPGRAHADQVAASLAGLAATVKTVELPGLPEKGDVSDWLDSGHTVEELLALVHIPPSDVAGTLPLSESNVGSAESATATLAEVEETFRRWLLMPDMGALRFALTLLVGHRLKGDPTWGLIVAPPSGSKTEIIRALESVPGVYPLSELTARTFASGLDCGKRDPSLLTRLSNHVLALKDFTTVLTMHREERQAILAQLREIYDGRYDKAWGTGKEVHWRGRLGFIAGVTPIIDVHHAVHQVLGERFLLFRSSQPDRREMALAAMRGRGHETEMREELRDIMARFAAGLSCDCPPPMPESYEGCLASLADVVSTARSGVIRDQRNRDLTLAPEPEAPARLAKQLAAITLAHAIIRGAEQVADVDYRFAFKVARDCIPSVRLLVMDALARATDYVSTSTIAAAVKYPTTTVRRALEDLAALGIVAISKAEKQGQADHWQLSESAIERVSQALLPEASSDSEQGTFPAMSEGGIEA